jgi:ribonuclease P protein component
VQRLKTRSQFQAVLAGGTLARTYHFALHCTGLNGSTDGPQAHFGVLFGTGDVWMGAMVPKRWAKRAVTRNAIKRQIYGIGADFESALPAAANVVRLRAAFDRKLFASASSDALKIAVRSELQQLFAHASGRHRSNASISVLP